jgi:hypothetical protein
MARDDFDDRPAAQLGPLDKMFRDTNIVILILFGVCCGLIALILSLVGVLTAKDPKAKSNATIVLAISGALTVIGFAVQFLGILAGAAAPR